MLRRGVVNYPKKKSKTEDVQIEGLPEPVRESIYDIMMKNLKLVDRATFIHRIIYAGEHTLMRDQDILSGIFLEIIDRVNEEHHLERLTGFLLIYTRHFVHMLEGDEDSINKHLKLLLKNKEHMRNFGTLKLLIVVHHINQRFHENWTSYNGFPPKLFQEININSSIEETGRHIYACIKKMYKLVYMYHGGTTESSIVEITPCSSAGASSTASAELIGIASRAKFESDNVSGSHFSVGSTSIMMSGNLTFMDPYRSILPESELVKFIINSKYTQTLQSYYELYRHVPQRDIYKDRVWPIPSDFIPYDVFTKPYDTVIELPREKTEEPRSKLLPTAAEEDNEEKASVDEQL